MILYHHDGIKLDAFFSVMIVTALSPKCHSNIVCASVVALFGNLDWFKINLITAPVFYPKCSNCIALPNQTVKIHRRGGQHLSFSNYYLLSKFVQQLVQANQKQSTKLRTACRSLRGKSTRDRVHAKYGTQFYICVLQAKHHEMSTLWGFCDSFHSYKMNHRNLTKLTFHGTVFTHA